MEPNVKSFFDKTTSTLTYVVYDGKTQDAVVIDSVWNYDSASSTLTCESVDEVTKFAKEQNLKVHYILETHAHADHLSGAQLLKEAFPSARTAIGVGIRIVQKVFSELFHLSMPCDGSQFDALLEDAQLLKAGALSIRVMNTPGHTPACVTYLIGDAAFTGDALFMPDSGTGRCDFPAGSAAELFHSVHDVLYTLPPKTRIFVGHDYQPGNRELRFESSVSEEKDANIHIKPGTSLETFVQFRNSRDKTLSAPKLLLPSIQANIQGGRLPKPESNGVSYLKIPLNLSQKFPDRCYT